MAKIKQQSFEDPWPEPAKAVFDHTRKQSKYVNISL